MLWSSFPSLPTKELVAGLMDEGGVRIKAGKTKVVCFRFFRSNSAVITGVPTKRPFSPSFVEVLMYVLL